MPLASGGSARSQGQAEDGQDAPRRPVQLQCAAMGPGDLLHQPEAGAVGGPAVRGQSDLRQSDRLHHRRLPVRPQKDPGFRGDTATNVTKPATLETGAEIKVPLFINPGDKIKIDTRTGEYLERCKA